MKFRKATIYKYYNFEEELWNNILMIKVMNTNNQNKISEF